MKKVQKQGRDERVQEYYPTSVEIHSRCTYRVVFLRYSWGRGEKAMKINKLITNDITGLILAIFEDDQVARDYHILIAV